MYRLPGRGYLCCCRCFGSVGLGILAAEALHAACCVHQALLAGKERVANRADFHVNVALVGRTGLKMVSAGAHHLHRGVIGMNLFLGHLSRQTFPAMFLFIVGGIARNSNSVNSDQFRLSGTSRFVTLNKRYACRSKETIHRFTVSCPLSTTAPKPSQSPPPPAAPSPRTRRAADDPVPAQRRRQPAALVLHGRIVVHIDVALLRRVCLDPSVQRQHFGAGVIPGLQGKSKAGSIEHSTTRI